MAKQLTWLYFAMFRADLDKRREEKQRLEEGRRKESMDKLRMDMEKSGGGTVVLNTGLKDKEKAKSKSKMDEDEDHNPLISEFDLCSFKKEFDLCIGP